MLVNEFGEVGLDHHLLRRAGGRVTLLGGGCVCCDGRGALAQALLDLLDVGEEGPVVLDGVGGTVHPPRHLDAWPDADRRSRLVFIVRGTEPHDIVAPLEAFEPVLGANPRPLAAGRS